MPPISLQKLLAPKRDLYRILSDLLRGSAGSISIFDSQERVLFGTGTTASSEKTPIVFEEQTLGWVEADDSSVVNTAALANLLAFLAGQEIQKKSLAAELVDRYRELNLHYHLTERLSAAAQPEPIARLAIEEAMRMIPASFGLVLLAQAEISALKLIAVSSQVQLTFTPCCLVEQVIASGKAELANAVSSREYFLDMPETIISVLCAPLKTEKNILGAILLVREHDQSFSAGDLKLLNTIAMQTAPAIEISRLYQLALEKVRLEREMQMARQVQESLLPVEIPRPPGWSIATRWQPAREVSGDFYDIIDEVPGRLGLVIADVTDKGMPASLFMAFVRTALRASVRYNGTPAESIAYANQLVCRDSYEGLFTTLIYARLQVENGEVEYVNAGHNPPLYYHARTRTLKQLTRTGLPIGVDEEAVYSFQMEKLEPGDFILFYTDGITEAINENEEEFGLERLTASLTVLSDCQVEQILDGLERDLAEFTSSAIAADDITMMVVKRENTDRI
jgi:phosphoserine phosphatase RsbU/P